MSVTVCLAPARTIEYAEGGGGHFWVYLNWALSLRASGCRVIWAEGVDLGDAANARRRRHGTDAYECVSVLKKRLEPYGFADAIALFPLRDDPLPRDLVEGCLDLDAVAEADLLLNLWHSLPARVVRRFRRSAFVDTDPGLVQIWMSTGEIRVAPHDVYFTVGETVGTPVARFPDCGLEWHYTPPPVSLPEWPAVSAEPGAPYTTVAHWWGGTVRFGGERLSNDKLDGFLEHVGLPTRTSVTLEQAICLGRLFDEWRARLEPLGWKLREAWDVTATPEDYRGYIERSKGEFSCAKPIYVKLETGWISDRTVCYLASGKPAIVQDTGPSRYLPRSEGLLRFRTTKEAARGLARVESDYEHHCRLARALAEEYFDGRRVVRRVLELALTTQASRPGKAFVA